MDDSSCDGFSTGSATHSVENCSIASTHSIEVQPTTPRKSIVWEHFTKISGGSVECHHCKKVLQHSSSSTTSLLRHMRTHPSTETTGGSDTDGVLKKLDRNSKEAKALTDAIAKMIVWDLQPFSIVENRGFRHFANTASPQYEIPSRTTFSRDVIPRMYVSEKERVKEILLKDIQEGVSTLAFTTDGWTSRAVESYISVTVHYISIDFEAKHFTLAMVPLVEKHTSKNLNDTLKAIIAEWELDIEPIRSIFFTTDNAANIVGAIKLSPKWMRIPCFAHTLQLAVKDSVKKNAKFTELCKKAQSIVAFFSRSTTANEKLAKAQQRLAPDKTSLKLIQNVETRWNSQFDMMDRLLTLKTPLSIVLCEKGMPATFTTDEWQRLQKYVEVLEPVKDATVLMSSEAHPTLSQYMPIVDMLKKAAKNEIIDLEVNETMDEVDDVEPDETSTESENEDGNKLASLLSSSLEKRFSFVDTDNDAIVFAMILNPHYKDRLIQSTEEKEKTLERLNCKALLESISTLGSSSAISTTSSSRREPSGEPKSKLQKLFDEALGTVENECPDADRELEIYIQEKVISRDIPPLKWWSSNCHRFPVLALLARQYLNIPASQTSSERLFSTAGNIVTPDRARLLSSNVEQIVFLNKNVV